MKRLTEIPYDRGAALFVAVIWLRDLVSGPGHTSTSSVYLGSPSG